MRKLISLVDHPNYLSFGRLDNIDVSAWEDDIVDGVGTSWGFENTMRANASKLDITVTYAHMKSTRRFNGKYHGYTYPYRFERPHEFTVVWQWLISLKMNMAFNWQWGSGVAFPLTGGKYNLHDEQGLVAELLEVTGG